MIQSIVYNVKEKEKLEILFKIISNIAKKPDDKYRKLKKNNEKLNKLIFSDENIMLIIQLLSFEQTEQEGDDCYFLFYKHFDQKLFDLLDSFLKNYLTDFEKNATKPLEENVNKISFNNNMNLDRMLFPNINQTSWKT